jgi:hypothetical protein
VELYLVTGVDLGLGGVLREVLSNEALPGLTSIGRGRNRLSTPQKIREDTRKCIIDGQPVLVTIITVEQG